MSPFFDTNILVYRVTPDPKARIAHALLAKGGMISVQVLNEFIDVIRRKQRFDWQEAKLAIGAVRALTGVLPMTVEAQSLGLEIASRHQFRIYDACIIASASLAGCKTLYTEDMTDGAVVAGVTIINPFKDQAPIGA